MKNYSNTYIFLYAAGLVVVVAALLSFAAVQLKPLQVKNIENKKKQDILASVNVESDATTAEALYAKYITESFVVDSKGQRTEGNAFYVSVKKELAKDPADRKLPVFVCAQEDNSKNYIVPVRGKGLGGPIWGFIAFKDDYNTIVGTTFDHSAETPGLGAKITLKFFRDRFVGKMIFDNAGVFKSVEVLKGVDPTGNPHLINAISGGTITSNGVNEMLRDCLINYEPYFKNN